MRISLAVALGLSGLVPTAAQAEQQTDQAADAFVIPGLNIPNVRSDSVEFGDDGSITLSGYVDIPSTDPRFRLQADRVVIFPPDDPDAPDGEFRFVAEGNVTLETADVLLNGSRMSGELRGATGVIENAFGLGPGNIYFRGERIEQIEPGTYRIERGVITPCTQSLPIWEFTASTVTLVADDHATMMWPRFKIKGFPVLVLPAIYWPIDRDRRSTGLLLPSIGSSTRKGFKVMQPFFWAINRSQDATLTYEHYARAGNGVSAEYRHNVSVESAGNARFFWLEGSKFTSEQIQAGAESVPGGWTFDGAHVHNLPRGFRLNANANFFNQKEFVQGFEDDFNRFTRRNSTIGVFLTRNWSSYSLNVVADHTRTFFGNENSVARQRLPEVEFRVRRRPLAEPLYYEFEGSYAGLVRREESIGDDPLGGRYQRIDAFPQVSLQLTQLPWLTFNPFLAWRSTWYSDRVLKTSEFESDPIFRNVYETGVEVIGPSIFRIFDTRGSDYSPRYKHIIEPRFTWGRLDELEFEGSREIIQFDEIDRFGGNRHFARASIINRFLAKRFPSPNADQRSVWEVFSVELGRFFDLKENPNEDGFPTVPLPWDIVARVTPTPAINFSGRIQFTPDWSPGGFTLAGTLNAARGRGSVTWFRNARTFRDEEDPLKVAVIATNRLTGGGSVDLLRQLITVRGHLTWDVTGRLLQEITAGGMWNTQCCSIGGQLRKINFSFRSETQFSVLVELLNVGSLGFGSER